MASQVTVLLATDEQELLDALGFALNHRGYRVVTALSGDGAVALMELQQPDIAVLDMLLSGQSGFQTDASAEGAVGRSRSSRDDLGPDRHGAPRLCFRGRR